MCLNEGMPRKVMTRSSTPWSPMQLTTKEANRSVQTVIDDAKVSLASFGMP